jgi:hypothetical protein
MTVTEPVQDVTGKIALIQRGGGCSIQDKIQAAKAQQARGIVIIDNDPDTRWEGGLRRLARRRVQMSCRLHDALAT